MKKQYKHARKSEKLSTNNIVDKPVAKPVQEKVPEIKQPKPEFLSSIKKDGTILFFIVIIAFISIVMSYSIISQNQIIEKEITIKLNSFDGMSVLVDECGNIYAYFPRSDNMNMSDIYKANLIKYPNYYFPQESGTLNNIHLLKNKSEYIKNC
jgi:hypothetical protein